MTTSDARKRLAEQQAARQLEPALGIEHRVAPVVGSTATLNSPEIGVQHCGCTTEPLTHPNGTVRIVVSEVCNQHSEGTLE